MAADEISILLCKAAVRTARSPGACWTGCSKSLAAHCGDLRHIGRRHECRGARGRLDAGGAEGARRALDYWRRVSRAAALSPLQRSPLDRLMGRWTLDTSPAYLAMDLMARLLSPYDLNPFGFNPLRTILVESIDFRACRTHRSSYS